MRGGMLTITFDDGYLNLYKNAFPVMEKYEMPGVVFIITGLVGEFFEGQSLMKTFHLKNLCSAKWEIGSHTVSHPCLTILSPQALNTELRESQKWGRNHGFSMMTIAYPHGNFNNLVQKKASEYYQFCRTNTKGLNNYNGKKKLKVITLWEEINECKQWVDRAKEENKWLIANVHGVVNLKTQLPKKNKNLFGWITRSKFEEFIRYAKISGINVKTFAQLNSEG